MKTPALCLCLWPLQPVAEDQPFLASLLDSLSRPDLSAPDLVAGMEAAGFSLDANIYHGPNGPNSAGDPLYYFITAIVIFPELQESTALIDCSRIGAVLLPSLPTKKKEAIFGGTSFGLTVLQFSDTAEFVPGARAQLWCEVTLARFGDAQMPTVDQIVMILRPRFDGRDLVEGPAGSESPDAGIGWVLYPPLTAKADDAGPQPGEAELNGWNDDPMADRRASWISYHHRAGVAGQSFTLVSHLAPQGF